MNRDAYAQAAEDYLRLMLDPLLDDADRQAYTVEHSTIDRAIEDGNGRMRVEPIHLFNVRIPASSVKFVLGKRGANVDALRTLIRAWSGATGWQARVDVYVRAL